MSDGHLYISDLNKLDIEVDKKYIWYDEVHESLLWWHSDSNTLRQIILRNYGRENHTLHHRYHPLSTSNDSNNCIILYDGVNQFNNGLDDVISRAFYIPPLLVRMSMDCQYIAIQKSDTEVFVCALHTQEQYTVWCKSKPGNHVLSGGVLWNVHSSNASSSQDLFLTTKIGIEQFRVSSKRKACSLHRTIGVLIHTFWYSPVHNTIAVASGTRANELVSYILKGKDVKKLDQIHLSTPLYQKSIYLASLYGKLYAVYNDPRSSNLQLYSLEYSNVCFVRLLNLLVPPGGDIEFSIVDNLLICHSMEFHVSVFFDIHSRENINEPFSSALPISLGEPSETAQAKGKKKEIMVYQGSDQWGFLWGNLIQRLNASNSLGTNNDNTHIELRRLNINLSRIQQSSSRHPGIIPFLLRRENSHDAVSLVCSLMTEVFQNEDFSITSLSTFFDQIPFRATFERSDFDVTDSNLLGSDDDDDGRGSFYISSQRSSNHSRGSWYNMEQSRSQDGRTVISQSVLYNMVWQVLLNKNLQIANNGQLSVYLFSLLKHLQKMNVPADDITYLAYAQALIFAKRIHELHQALLYNVVGDSVDLAHLLVLHGRSNIGLSRILLQDGLDMFFRLGEIEKLIICLLDVGEVDRAISISLRNIDTQPYQFNASVIPGEQYFDAVVHCLRQKKRTSPLIVQQKLVNLLTFLREWDQTILHTGSKPERFSSVALAYSLSFQQRPTESSEWQPSRLAKMAKCTFPDELLTLSMTKSLRAQFGFPPPTSADIFS